MSDPILKPALEINHNPERMLWHTISKANIGGKNIWICMNQAGQWFTSDKMQADYLPLDQKVIIHNEPGEGYYVMENGVITSKVTQRVQPEIVKLETKPISIELGGEILDGDITHVEERYITVNYVYGRGSQNIVLNRHGGILVDELPCELLTYNEGDSYNEFYYNPFQENIYELNRDNHHIDYAPELEH